MFSLADYIARYIWLYSHIYLAILLTNQIFLVMVVMVVIVIMVVIVVMVVRLVMVVMVLDDGHISSCSVVHV